jgi:SCY1-like protein 2
MECAVLAFVTHKLWVQPKDALHLSTAAMFAVATSFFSRSNIFQNYNIGPPAATSSAQRTPTPSAGPSATLPAVAHVPAFQVGLWRVQSASHKTTNKRVSVWTFDKRNVEMDRMTPAARENAMEVLKAEVRTGRSIAEC